VKARRRSNTNATADEIAQRQQLQAQREQQSSKYTEELASAFYTLNSKYRISWECAELLIDLVGGGRGVNNGELGCGFSSASGVSPSSSNEIMSGAGAANSGVGKKRSKDRAITLVEDEVIPTSPTSSMPAALSASSSSMPIAASNTNNSWRAPTGRHDLSHRQLALLREMLNHANATVDAYS
jgi:serine/arginine repetitive matrix protein 2